nr:hypothetical protein [uncultured Bacteroides sp.]
METVIAKIMYGIDGEHMYKGLPPYVCPNCHTLLKRTINLDYKIKQKSGDLIHTYDGYCIVSEAFMLFCKSNKYPELEFVQLPQSPNYYYFNPKKIFYTDAERRHVQFINPCKYCGGYEEVIGSTPNYIKQGIDIQSDDFICRSDYEFGTGERKSPLIVIGLETEKKIKLAKLKNIYFAKIFK